MRGSPGKLLVYLFAEGKWAWAWDKVAINALSRLYGGYKVVDMDSHLTSNLTQEEVQALIEAMDEAEASRSR